MNVKRFVCCLLASVLLLGVSLISCGNSSRAKAKNEILLIWKAVSLAEVMFLPFRQ